MEFSTLFTLAHLISGKREPPSTSHLVTTEVDIQYPESVSVSYLNEASMPTMMVWFMGLSTILGLYTARSRASTVKECVRLPRGLVTMQA